jgi:sodium-dependent dicarboxylate transporter 2/3/5
MATLVGTPTNMIFYRSYSEHYGHVEELSFADWMVFATPVSLVLLAATWFLLSRMIPREIRTTRLDRSVFRQRLASLGPITRNERIVGALFLITAVLWFTRSEISVGNFTFRGWASVFRYGEQIQDGTIAIAISLLLFLIPDSSRRGERLLEWKDAARLPFEILLLFGSGFALSKGFEASGLSDWLANALLSWRDVPTPMLVLCIGLVVTLISEFASNVASIQLVLPILISLQQALDLPPQLLLIPATLAASCGFMLPVATAPNTIVFSSGKIKVREMAGIGIMIDVIAIALISGTCIFIFR